MRYLLTFVLFCFSSVYAVVELGVDCFFEQHYHTRYAGKRVGLITNHTAVNARGVSTLSRFLRSDMPFRLTALFSPEHGLSGVSYAGEHVAHGRGSVPIYSLHGAARRPTGDMLKGLDVFFYDIQDVGVRCYTYATTLFYAMEEAAKRGIEVVVFDRPNPIGGVVDGPMLEPHRRSFIGYANVSYCHGMTIGELARFFNAEYNIGCKLSVVPMRGWKRSMPFAETGLLWIPTSPNIPEADTPMYYASTGAIGELGIVNIGVGYSLPFKLVGAEWIDAERFAGAMNAQQLPGVHFVPFHYRPFYGEYGGKTCHGVLIRIHDPVAYKPMRVQFTLLGVLKTLYPDNVGAALAKVGRNNKELFAKAVGSDAVLTLLQKERYVTWKLLALHSEDRARFERKRSAYLLREYDYELPKRQHVGQQGRFSPSISYTSNCDSY